MQALRKIGKGLETFSRQLEAVPNEVYMWLGILLFTTPSDLCDYCS